MHLLWLMLALSAKSITSGKLTCNTTTSSNGTFYKVSDFGKSHCGAQWIDVENHTLADGDGKNDSLVVASNFTTLHTYNCYNKVMYVLDCYPSTQLNKVACVVNCSESAGKTEGTSNHSWVILVIFIILAILLVISLVGMYYCRRQRRNQSGL